MTATTDQSDASSGVARNASARSGTCGISAWTAITVSPAASRNQFGGSRWIGIRRLRLA